MGKLIKAYNLEISSFPNFVKSQKEGALKFLLHKRYVERTIGREAWVEMVLEVIENNENLVLKLIDNVVIQDVKEALYWAQKFSVPKEKWPYRLKVYFNR